MFHMTVIFDQKRQKLMYDRKLKEGSGDSTYGLEVVQVIRHARTV